MPRVTPLTYSWLYAAIRPRFASADALEAALPHALPPAQLRAKGDDRYLSAMAQRVFQAGMQHAVVDARWPAFETALAGFDPRALAALGAPDIEAHMANRQLIRDRAKLATLPRNARFVLDVAREHGSFGAFLADWPDDDTIGLWRVLAERGARLGGRSAAGFLRLAGKDTFLLTSHVVARLVAAGVVPRTPTSAHGLRAVQDCFHTLRQESGRPLCQLSAMLAWSIPPQA